MQDKYRKRPEIDELRTPKPSREWPLYNTKRAIYSDQQNRYPERPETHYAVQSEKSQQSHRVPCVPHPGCTSGIKLNAGSRR